MQRADSASPAAVQAYVERVYGPRIPESQFRAIGRYDSSTGRLVGDVTPASIDSLVLAGCGHPDYSAVRAPALVIYAVVDSAPQVFPLWARLDRAQRTAARRYTTFLQHWAAAERTRVARELPHSRVLELHGANHYVFASHPRAVSEAMRAFLSTPLPRQGRPVGWLRTRCGRRSSSSPSPTRSQRVAVKLSNRSSIP